MRQVAYDQRISEATVDARQQAELLLQATTRSGWPTGDNWGQFPYELVTSGGLLSSSSQLKPFETGGHAFMPLPGQPGNPNSIRYRASSTVRFPGSRTRPDNPLAGTEVTVTSTTLHLYDLLTVPGNDTNSMPNLPDNAQVRAYVFVTTASARAAVAALDRVLLSALPVCVLLVSAAALVASRQALRPVETIRVRTAAVTATDPRERVAVPDTGDEIARLAATINATLERLDAAARAHRRFVADAAHELRSPLTTLLATLEVAEAYPDRADWPQTVATARRQTHRIRALADDLLLLASLDAAAPDATTNVDLAALARGTSADYHGSPGGVSVVCDADQPAIVTGDPAQLERLLRNLLDNATRYGSTRAEVSVRTVGAEVVLSVYDDGPGIPVQDRERVFERFTRLDYARSRKTGGSGLGLAIAREIAQRHHATLTIDGSPSGTRFVARLPRAR